MVKYPVFTMLIGIPGSGKSTWLKDNAKGAEVVCPDHIRRILAKDINDQTMNDVIWKVAQYLVYRFLREGKDTILDATNVNTRLRNEFLKTLPSCKSRAVLFEIAPGEAFERIRQDQNRANVPEYTIYRMWGEFEYTKTVIDKEFGTVSFANE